MSKSDIFVKVKHGDRKTVVKELKKGAHITYGSPPDAYTIIIKKRCKVKVTQEWDAKEQYWRDVSTDYESAVDIEDLDEKRKRDGQRRTEDVIAESSELPRAEVRRSWWQRFRDWAFGEP